MCHLQSSHLSTSKNGKQITVTFILLLAIYAGPVFSQISASQVLDMSIRFHDPHDVWDKKPMQLNLTESRPGSADRTTSLQLNLAQSNFTMNQHRDSDIISYSFHKDSLLTKVNGSSEASDSLKNRLNISRDRARMLRNYYTYLWMLPMKLNDPGTVLHDEVTETTYDGYPVYKLKVTYDEEVGHDTWYFYFDRSDFQMRGYQFFHDEMKNDGEYITLSGIAEVGELLLPLERRWFTNHENTYLGTDRISQIRH